MSRSFFKSFLSTLLAFLMIVTVAAVPSSAASAKLSKSSISLTKGYSTTLSVSGGSGTVTWSTGNKSVATVSSKGKVVGKGVGSTYIYAKVGSSTLKCKVSVVAGKIAVGTSSVEMEPGDSVKVKIKAMGTHTLSVGTTNKNVVKASWSGAKFSGDYINLTLKAVGTGSAKVKVYAKNYPNSIYKYISVDVIGDDDILDDDPVNNNSSTSGRIQSSVSSVTVAENATQTFTVYASNSALLNSLKISSSSIWGFGVKATKDTSKNALIITISGYSAETGNVKIYSSSDSSISVTIPVTVTSAEQNLQYYTLLKTRPASKILQTDTIIAFQSGLTTYYMLVPYGYDPAYANTIAAKGMNSYSYNLVYDSIPQKKLSNDQIVTKSVIFNGAYQTRYVLAPYGYDEAFVNTVFAKYSGTYEYYVVYTESPSVSSQLDKIISWTINRTNASTGRTETSTRYLLCPYNYDQAKVDEIKNKDTTANIGIQAYTVYGTPPYPDTTNYNVIQWTKLNGENRYMIVPKSNCDYIKRNDAVRKDVGYFSYYVAYSEAPTVTNTAVESVYSLTTTTSSGGFQTVYVLYNPNDADWQTKVSSAINGNAYIGTRQGTVTQ